MDKRELGRRYELFAADYLKKQGYRIVELNFCCRQGEVDIIARDKDVLVFIEVKYRKNLHSGAPAEAVDAKKQQKIRSAAPVLPLPEKGMAKTFPAVLMWSALSGEKISLIRDAF